MNKNIVIIRENESRYKDMGMLAKDILKFSTQELAKRYCISIQKARLIKSLLYPDGSIIWAPTLRGTSAIYAPE